MCCSGPEPRVLQKVTWIMTDRDIDSDDDAEEDPSDSKCDDLH